MSSTCKSIVNSKFFQRLILVTILLAGVVVGVQTFKAFAGEHVIVLNTLDLFILGIFVIEAVIKILAEGNRPQNYFKNPWNVFDFIIVVACLLGPVIHLGADFLADDALEIADHGGVRVWACHCADAIEGIAHVCDPVAQGIVHGVLERATA